MLKDPDQVCGASIGMSGTGFCTSMISSCLKSSHKIDRKLPTEENSIYIMSRNNVASITVHMKLSELPDVNNIKELLGRQAKPGIWSAFFINCQEGIDQESLDPDQLDASWIKPGGSNGSPGLILSSTRKVKQRFAFGKESAKKLRSERSPGFSLGIKPRLSQDSRTPDGTI
jgi:hypothetical protein